MATLANIDSVFDDLLDETLDLPYRGKTYVIRSVDGATGLAIAAMVNGKKRLGDEEELNLWETLLASAWDDLQADEVPWPVISHMGATALTWLRFGIKAAEQVWVNGADPKASVKKPQDRRSKSVKQRSTN